MFFAMLYRDLAETTDTIELSDCDSEGFLELLRYMYCDEAELTGSNVMQVLYLAKKFMVPSLVMKCTEFLEQRPECKKCAGSSFRSQEILRSTTHLTVLVGSRRTNQRSGEVAAIRYARPRTSFRGC